MHTRQHIAVTQICAIFSIAYVSYVHILYLRRQGAILMTPCMSVPISTTTNCELFKTLTLRIIIMISYALQLLDRQ